MTALLLTRIKGANQVMILQIIPNSREIDGYRYAVPVKQGLGSDAGQL